MYRLEHSDHVKGDLLAARKIIRTYFTLKEVPEKIARWHIHLNEALDGLFDALKETPKRWQVYQFKPPLETQHEYRAAEVDWFTVFWWVDDDARVCHVYRILDSKQDFTRVGGW